MRCSADSSGHFDITYVSVAQSLIENVDGSCPITMCIIRIQIVSLQFTQIEKM